MTSNGTPDPAPEQAHAAAVDSDDSRAAPTLSIADAARATGTNRPLIRKKLQSGEFPRAAKDAQGFWRIAESDLVNAGLVIAAHAAPDPETEPAAGAAAAPTDSEVQRLRNELSETQHRAERAEALLEAERRLTEERGRALEIARSTIEAFKLQVPGLVTAPPAPARPEPAGVRRSNWQAALRAARAKDIEARAARAARARLAEQPPAAEPPTVAEPTPPAPAEQPEAARSEPPKADVVTIDDDASDAASPPEQTEQTRRRWRRG